MIIGFTGTQTGMTEDQYGSVQVIIQRLKVDEAHHGQCIGADMDFHEIIRQNTDAKIVSHPPIVQTKIGECEADEYRNPQDYLVRNQDIVNECDVLVATPKENNEVLRSGTWATIRRATKAKKPVLIVNPDGMTIIR